MARAGASARAIALAWARGIAQVLFGESAAGGVLVLAGLSLTAPTAAIMGAAACLVATLTARARRYPTLDWLRGLYGYTGALIGMFWGVLFEPGVVAWLALGVAALLAAPLTRVAHRALTPVDIPALALPALGLVWLLAPLLELAQVAPPAVSAASRLAGWCLVLLGLVLSSRLLAGAALAGAVVGLLLSLVVGPGLAPGILSNTVPTAAALGAVLLPWSGAGLAVGALAAVAAGALWWLAVAALGSSGALALVAPFNLVTVAALVALRVPALRRRLPGRPAPLPLAAVGRPEQARAAWLARRRLGHLIRHARSICVMTGAGVSTAAGLPDFRGPDGLWTRTRRITFDDFVTAAAARADYWREEEAFFRLAERVKPTALHRALATLDRQSRLSAVITQNVDGLHQAAGVRDERVIELHGCLREARCLDCGRSVARQSLSEPIVAGVATFYCPECQGLLKSGSIMFGEPVDAGRLDAALQALLAADLLLVLGTSLAVAPASDVLRWAREAGIPIAIVNATATPYDADAAVTVTADVDTVVCDVLEEVTARERGPRAAQTGPAGRPTR